MVLKRYIKIIIIVLICFFTFILGLYLLSQDSNNFISKKIKDKVPYEIKFFLKKTIFHLPYTKREFNLRQLIWIGYLFMISAVEEIAFRLSLPLLITSDVTGISFFWIGALISNLLFATIHYFTLRWKLNACIFTFLGGMGFSRMLDTTGDLTAVILLHWAITFLNTPAAPKGQIRELNQN